MMARSLDKEKIKTGQSLCGYVRLCKVWFDDRKVKKSGSPSPKSGSPRSSPVPSPKLDKKLKSWQKRWVVITIESIQENTTMKYSKTEEQWLASPNGKNIRCEPLNDMIMLRKIHLPGKPHILALVFSTHSLWLSFKSHTSLTTWMEKLSHITKRYLVQLVKSTNETIKPATYLLQVHSDKITTYRTTQNDLEEIAWSWDVSSFYAYRVHKRFVTEIEVIIGKDSDLNGHFHFIGPDLENLCKCIVDNIYHESDEPCQKGGLQHGPSTNAIDSASNKDNTASTDNISLSVQCNPSYMSLPHSPSPYFDSDSDSDYYVNDSDDNVDQKLIDLKKSISSPLANDYEVPVSAQNDEYEYMETGEDDGHDYVFM